MVEVCGYVVIAIAAIAVIFILLAILVVMEKERRKRDELEGGYVAYFTCPECGTDMIVHRVKAKFYHMCDGCGVKLEGEIEEE